MLKMRELASPIISIIGALIVGAILILAIGENPLTAYYTLFKGAIFGRENLIDTLTVSTPLILTGLATAIAFRAKIFNMGVEGQLYLGAFAAAFIGFSFNGLPPFIHIILAISMAALAGGLFALIPGLLKGFLNVNEIVTTLMLNYVAILFTSYLASYPFKAEGVGFSATPMIFDSAILPRLTQYGQLNLMFVVSLIIVFLVYTLFYKTKLGYEIKAIGLNREFAEASGMNLSKKIILIMVISGMIGGIAGAGEILGVHHRFISEFSPGYGWDGLIIALLSANNPIAVLIVAIFFGILKSGGGSIDLYMDIPRSITDVIQATIIFFLAANLTIRHFSKIKRLFVRKQVDRGVN